MKVVLHKLYGEVPPDRLVEHVYRNIHLQPSRALSRADKEWAIGVMKKYLMIK